MSQGSLPTYSEISQPPLPQRRQSRVPIPVYTPPESSRQPLSDLPKQPLPVTPVSLAHRIGDRSRSRSRPPSNEWIKLGKHLVLRLSGAQVPGAELPVYGLGAAVEGKLELTKPEGINSIEVKVRDNSICPQGSKLTIF